RKPHGCQTRFGSSPLRTCEYDVEDRGPESSARTRHRRTCRPAIGARIIDLELVEVAIGIERAATDGKHAPAHRCSCEMVTRRGHWSAMLPALRGRIIDRDRVEQPAARTNPTDHDETAVQ